jgi:regulatory protein
MDELDEAREVALKYLDYAARTSVEVRRRLARSGFDEETMEAVVAELERAGLLDDARFSRDWVADRAGRKRLGRERLVAELRRKGVGREIAEAAVAGMDREAETTAARELARKRLGSDDPADSAVRRRLAAFLQRRGYDWETIEQVFSRLFADDV